MSRLKLLIVDDEPGMRKGAARVLKKHKVRMPKTDEYIEFDISTAEDGKTTWEQLDNSKFDLLMLDYKLPDTTGLEILQKLQNMKGKPMTVMMTAYASLEVAVSATKNGAFDFLAKPFSPEELRSVITKATHSLVSMRKAQQLAEEKKRMRFQFLSVLSHELKAPLAAVEGYLYSMRDHALGDDLKMYDKCIRRSLVRVEGMRKLIFDLLDLTRIESGQKRRDLQQVKIMEAIEMAVETVANKAEERGIDIHIDGDENLTMHADINELGIIANNLITNAVKYNKDGGSVNITLLLEDDFVVLKVADTGYGMTPEEKDRLFGEFVRIRNEQTRGIEGSGLGLSILKKLTRLYGGKIDVKSQKDIGSTFTVYLKNEIKTEDELCEDLQLTQL
ncbi:MAG: hypothetical protein CR997_04240 [Acidobacteria bacterium]|nr:MAG: hypothetical protein CR997_04240 [Acidobacteriota bacterium]